MIPIAVVNVKKKPFSQIDLIFSIVSFVSFLANELHLQYNYTCSLSFESSC